MSHAQAAVAAANAQQNHYQRLANNNSANHNHSVHSGGNSELGTPNGNDANMSDDHRRLLQWVQELLNGQSREQALMELSKKREQVPELAMIIWYSFGE